MRGSAFRHVGIVIDGTPTQLLLHAIRGTSDTGSIAMINTDVLEHARRCSRGPHAAAAWRLARRDARVRRARGIARSAGRARGRQRHERVGRLRGPDRHAPSRLVARLDAQELHRLAHPEDRAGRRQHDRLQGRAGARSCTTSRPRQQLQFLAIAGDADYREVRHVAHQRPADGQLAQRDGLAVLAVPAPARGRHAAAVVRSRATSTTTALVGQHLAEGDSRQAIWRGDALVPLGRGWTLEGGARREALDDQRDAADVHERRPAAACAFGSSEPDRRRRHDRSGWGQVDLANRPRAASSAGVRGDRSHARRRAGAVLPWLLGEHTFGTTTFRGGRGPFGAVPRSAARVRRRRPTPVPETAHVVRPQRRAAASATASASRPPASIAMRERRAPPHRRGSRRSRSPARASSKSTFPVFSPTLDRHVARRGLAA